MENYIDFDCDCGEKHLIKSNVSVGNYYRILTEKLSTANNKRVVVTATEEDYCRVGRNLKERLTSCGYFVELFLFDDKKLPLMNVLEDFFVSCTSTVVCLSVDLLSFALRYICAEKELNLILVPCDVNFSDMFVESEYLPFIGGTKRVSAPLSKEVIIDRNLIFGCKKKKFCECYLSLCSLSLVKFDYCYNAFLSGAKPCGQVLSLLNFAEKVTRNIDKMRFSSEALLRAQLCTAVSFGINGSLFESATRGMAKILETVDKGKSEKSFYEFYCYEKLLKIYRLYFTNNFKFLVLPCDMTGTRNKLFSLTGIDCDSKEFIEKSRANNRQKQFRIQYADYALKMLDRQIAAIKNQRDKARYFYNIRNREEDFSVANVKDAFRLSALISNGGVINSVYTDGLMEIL